MSKIEVSIGEHGSWIWKDKGAREPNLILFVHGYTGDAEATWMKFPHLVRQVGQGFDQGFEVASFGYETNLLTNYQGVTTLSQLLLTFLDSQGNNARIFLVTHSLGGVVARKFLVDAYQKTHDRHLFHQVQQVHFIGVPHEGAAFAPKALDWFKRINPLAAELRRDSPLLGQILEDWNQVLADCRANATDAPELFNYVGNRDWLVPLEQTIERFHEMENVRVVEGSHIEITKPHDAENSVFRLVRRRILGANAKPNTIEILDAARRLRAGGTTI